MSTQLKSFFALLVCAILFASFSIWVRLLSTELLAYQQIGFRNAIALVLATIVIFITKQSFRSLSSVSPLLVVGYTLTFPLAVVLYTLSVLQTTIMTTIFGLYLGSLLTSLVIGIIFFKEAVTAPKMFSLFLVLIGLLCYLYPFSGQLFSVGLLLGVLSGGCDAVANSFRKFLAGKIDRFVLVAMQMVGGLMVAGVLMTVFNQLSLIVLSPLSWIVGLIFGASLVAISYLTLIGFAHFDLNLGTVVLSSELFFASIFAYLVFQERVSAAEIIGGCFIIAATGIANVKAFNMHAALKKFVTRLNVQQ